MDTVLSGLLHGARQEITTTAVFARPLAGASLLRGQALLLSGRACFNAVLFPQPA